MIRALLRLLALLAIGGAAPAWAGCALGRAGATAEVSPVDGRAIALHRPPGAGDAAPLVVLLHGSGDTGRAFLATTGLADAADRHGFLVAAPDAGIAAAKGFYWNIPGVPTVAGTLPPAGAADDVAYLARVVDALVAAGCADRARVYAVGLSGGGRMASWLGCVAAERYAAIAPVVGLRAGRPLADDPTRPDPVTCTPGRAVPVLAFAGDADTTNPIAGGGAPYWRYPMAAALQRWAAIDGCASATTRWVTAKVYEQRYAGCAGDGAVAARVTVGGGHAWVVDNDALWAFLSRYRR